MTIKTCQRIFLFLSLGLLAACKNDIVSPGVNAGAVPAIDAGTTLTAKGGSMVTITGQNLTANGMPTATLNHRKLTIQSATNTSLQVLIPRLAGSGKIMFAAGGKNFDGPQFNYQYVATVSTVAGSGTVGRGDGPVNSATFNCPWGIVADVNGDLYIADVYNRLIRKISASTGQVSSTSLGTLNFSSPYNLAIDTIKHILYITDFNAQVMKMNTDGSNQSVIYIGPMPNAGIALGPDGLLYVGNNIAGTILKMNTDGSNPTPFASGITTPRNIIFDRAGEMFVAGYNSLISSAGVYQVTSTGVANFLYPDNAFQGWEIARDGYGNFYEADHFNNIIKLIDPNGNVVTIAGNGTAADVDGVGTAASFNGPQGLVIDGNGNLYVTTYNYDTAGGNKVRKIVIN